MAKHADELPPGFSLENYRDAAIMGPLDWATNIEHRLLIGRFMKAGREGNADYRQAAETLIASLFRTPIVRDHPGRWSPAMAMTEAMAITGDMRSSQDVGFPRRPPPLEPMTVGQWYRFKSLLGAINLRDRVPPGYWRNPIDVAASDVSQDVFWRDRVAHVTINLDASDEAIQKALRKFLTEAREQRLGKPGPLTGNKREQWHANAVLPYADLLLWQEWTGCTLSPDLLIQALLPPDKHGVERPLKGTKADYERVMTEETAALLRQEH